MKKGNKLNVLILTLVSFIVLYFVLRDDFDNIYEIIMSINIWWLVLAIILMVLSWFFSSLGIYALTNRVENRPSPMTVFKLLLITNYFSAITPFSTGGQPSLVYNLNKRGVDATTATRIVVEHSTVYQVVLVALGMIAIVMNYFYGFFPPDNLLKKLVTMGFLINALVIVLLLFVSFGKRAHSVIVKIIVKLLYKLRFVKNKETALAKINKRLDDFYLSAAYFSQNKMVLFKVVICNVMSFLLLYTIPLVIAYSFGITDKLGLTITLISSVYVMLIGSFVPIPGGTGGLEFGFAQFFGFFIKGPVLMAILLMWRLVTYYLGMFIGGLTFIFYKERRS